MPLKLTCPHCGNPTRVVEPLPLPGSEVQCACGAKLTVSYPPGVMERLEARGKTFQSEESAVAAHAAKAGLGEVPKVPVASAPPSPESTLPEVVDGPPPVRDAQAVPEAGPEGTVVDPTRVDGERVEPAGAPSFAEIDRTVPSARTPYGGLAANLPEPEAQGAISPPGSEPDEPPPAEPTVPAERAAAAPKAPASNKAAKPTGKKPAKPAKRKRGWFRRLLSLAVLTAAILSCVGAIGAGAGYWHYSQDLPTIEALRAYEPPAVTVVYDHQGRILGEIYEERRYVVPLEQIPDHVEGAFIAAEDANFWKHGGVDYIGIARAMVRNLKAGRMAQGASTITQQVTRNFLLTREKKLERKIKEIILAWRIEKAYDKEHILYLYLNQIYLGSHAYGVEAASRTYFDKGVADVTLAEAAILAGLPQRPSDYSPHRHWDKARQRQEYVLGQMLAKDYITQAEMDAALAEDVRIIERRNEFLAKAPHFTEYVRRYLVENYGEERVLNEGLQVVTTCDLDLQQVAQEAVWEGVHEVDQRMGFRREGVETLADEAAIAAKRAEHEAAMRQAWATEQDAAGRVPPPETSILEADRVYDAVVLEVEPKWAKVGIGDHVGVIPIEWSKWVFQPNPRRSWRYREQNDLTELVDDDGDRHEDGSILRVGDAVLVKVVALSTADEEHAKAFRRTPGEDEDLVAVRLWQEPEVEGALMSFDLETGAVRTMVGGSDFTNSQFNRCVQSRRQVGSTFKPIVYGAAIESRKVTTASMVADAPLAFATNDDFIWKPANYGRDFLGNVTLRRALTASKNTCTVRVLESTDPGMNDDIVYAFARKLGIGGPPTHTLPEDWVPSPDNDLLCPWIRETPESTICMDRNPPKDPDISNTRHRMQMKPDDVHMCRACDMSMGLGSASLTMEELMRAYSAFATDGYLVQPYYIEEVRDRRGNVLERHEPQQFEQVLEVEVAAIERWLLRGVVEEGTGARANRLGIQVGGKTGTTNEEKDTWFVGFNTEVITAAWVGYDQPRTLGISSTGGRTALPIWIDYMRVAAPKERSGRFDYPGEIEWVQIDEATGRRVTSGGRRYPFLEDTVPESTGIAAGQLTLEDVTTEL